MPAMLLLCALLAVSPSLAQARREFQQGHLEDVLFALRPDRVQPADIPAATALLTDAAVQAQSAKKLDLAQELLDQAYKIDPLRPRTLELLSEWALADGYGILAKKYAEIWAKTQPNDQRAQEFRRYVLQASEHARPREPPPPPELPRSRKIVLYGTSWCGVCKRARGYLIARGLPFEDLDIEKNFRAAAELANKERASGFRHRGVPVIDVHGKLMEGFSARAIDEALKN
jgi:glutaredoxin